VNHQALAGHGVPRRTMMHQRVSKHRLEDLADDDVGEALTSVETAHKWKTQWQNDCCKML